MTTTTPARNGGRRPALHLVSSAQPPARRTARLRLWLLADRLDDAAWPLIAAMLNRAAPQRMRERAYRAGFARALGTPGRRFWTGHMHEFHAGNEAGLTTVESAGGQPATAPRLCLVRAGGGQ